MLTSNALIGEQLRHLLTTHNGCIPIDQVEPIYTATFGIQTHINITDIVECKKLVRVAPHIVNVIGNNKWMVWAPTGRPYPSRGRKTSLSPTGSDDKTSPHTGKIQNSGGHNKSTQNNKGGTLKGDTGTVSEWSTINVDNTQLTSNSLCNDASSIAQHLNNIKLDNHYSVKNDEVKSTELASERLVDGAKDDTSKAGNLSSNNYTESIVVPPGTSTKPVIHDDKEVSASAYGFLEETLEPELMAELRASGEQHQQREKTLGELLSSQPLSEQAIQLLIHYAKPLSEIDLEASDSDGGEDRESAELGKPCKPVDYLQSGLTPDQVLEEMRKLKEHSGGYLSPVKMEPFLTYFGELSSRELDRLESLEEKEKPKPKKGASKKKRVMAIRFPGKSPVSPMADDEDPYKEQRLYSTQLLKDKLPAAPDFENMSDSSDSDGSCPRPLERKEYIQTLLKRGIPSLTDEEVMQATRVVSDEQNDHMAVCYSKIDVPSFEPRGEAEIVNDLPRPLLSSSEVGLAASRKLFDDSHLVLDSNALATTDSEATEWPDVI